MGLDAVVYKSRDFLNLGVHGAEASTIEETGETYFENPKYYKDYPEDYFEAVSFRIGNITAVAELLGEVQRLMGSNSFIAQRVLYSGSHSGDTITLSELEELSREVDTLLMSNAKSAQLAQFLSQLGALLDAARSHRNPIVFV